MSSRVEGLILPYIEIRGLRGTKDIHRKITPTTGYVLGYGMFAESLKCIQF